MAMALLMLPLAGLAAFAGTSGASPQAPQGSRAPLTIAVIGAFTGTVATYGIQEADGLKFAEKFYGSTINGHPIKIAKFTTKCSGGAAEIAWKSAQADHPIAVLGPSCSGGTEAIQSAVEAAGVPMMNASYLPSLSEHGDKLYFRNSASDATLTRVMAHFIKQKGYKRVAILHGTSAFTAGEGTAMTNALAEVGINPVANVSYTTSATTFSGQIETLKSAKPKAVFFASYDPTGARACAQMRHLGLNAECLGNESMAYPDSAAAGGKVLNGAYDFAPFVPAALPKFSAAWKKQFGVTPTDESYTEGYVGSVALLQAIKDAGKNPTPKRVALMLHKKTFTENFGIGKVRFGSTGDNKCATMYIGMTSNAGKTFKVVQNHTPKCNK